MEMGGRRRRDDGEQKKTLSRDLSRGMGKFEKRGA